MSYDRERSNYEHNEMETPSGGRGPFQGRWNHRADPHTEKMGRQEEVQIDPTMEKSIEKNPSGEVGEMWLEVGPRVQEPIERKPRQVKLVYDSIQIVQAQHQWVQMIGAR